MSSSSEDLYQRVLDISSQMNRIVPIIQIILGTLGNILNIFIFTRRTLRISPCSFYIIASSINNIFVLYVALLTRLLSSGWKIDPSNSSNVLCKLRIFFVYISLCLIQWFMVVISIDQFFSTCRTVRYRQWSSLSIARKTVGITLLITTVAHFHVLVWWSVDFIGDNLYCNIFLDNYIIAFQALFVVFSCVLAPILMAVFGILTVVNVKKIRHRIAPQPNNLRNNQSASKERQLMRMISIQVVVVILCTAPFSAANIISMLEAYMDMAVYDSTTELIVSNTSRLILYFNPMVGFYIYTFSSRTFRFELKQVLRRAFYFVRTTTGFGGDLPI